MRFSALLRAALVVLSALIVTALFAPPALADPDGAVDGTPRGSIGIRLLDAPEKLRDDPRAQLYIIDNLPPGSTITRHVMVTNNTGERATIKVYAGPAKIVDGAFTPTEPGTSNLLSSWTSVNKPEVTLANGAQAKVAVKIAVPDDAPEVEQYGVIWASHLSTPADRPEDSGANVGMESRVGVRMYISAGEGNGPPADFTINGLTAQRESDGSATVLAEVTNTGGRAVDLSGTLKLSDGPAGTTAGPIDAQGLTVAPGETGEVRFPVPNSTALPDGPWTAEAQLTSGVNTHDVTESIHFSQSSTESTSGSKVWTIVIVLLILAALILAALYVVRRKRAAAATQESESTP